VLVETTAFSALREASGVYLHTANLSAQQVLPGSVPAPGPAPQGELLPTPDGRAIVVSSGPAFAGQVSGPAYLTAYQSVPLRALPEAALDYPDDLREVPGAFVSADNRLDLVVLVSRVDDAGVWQGRLELRPFGGSVGPVSAAWPLPGSPEACVALGGGRVAVLCRGAQGSGSILHVRDVYTGTIVTEAVVSNAAPAGLQLARDGRALYVLVSGYAADRPSGDAVSWLYQFALPGLRLAGKPLELPGVAEPEAHPLAAGQGGCWVATRAPSSGFDYVSFVSATAEGLTLGVQAPYFEVNRPARIAPAPSGAAVAVAVDRRLEIWPQGKPSGPNAALDNPVESLRWSEEGLIVGEGSRLHAVDPATAALVSTVSFGTGIVTDAFVLPSTVSSPKDVDADGLGRSQEISLATDYMSPDFDSDGIPDGLDPEPVKPSPRLVVPQSVVFHGESAGQELRAVRIDPAFGAASEWRIDVDAAQAPWLSVYPRQGKAGEVFYMGVDPARYPADSGLLQTLVTVRCTGTTPGIAAAGSPTSIRVEVVPAPAEVPNVAWLLDKNTAAQAKTDEGLDRLGSLLSSPPLRFQQTTEPGLPPGGLARYRVVVLTAEAVAHGRVTRQAILDYVAAGGAILLLGNHLPKDDAAALEQWLSPLGLYLEPNAALDGTFATVSRDWLCRNWAGFPIRDGMGLRSEQSETVMVPGPTGSGLAVFVAVPHGRGRVAVLASPTPLENGSLAKAENRRFAADLFRWLARIGTEYEDVDGDGIPDSVEDANGNAMRNPGETDRFVADSDGDGLPDGVEDANHNGKVDEGETSPLNADSDGDGISDGADLDPLPPADAPHVEKVEPSEGPAQGGNVLFVSGRNFGPNSQLWLGDRPAIGLRRFGTTALAAEAPPAANDGGDVDVRVTNSGSGLAGVLPGGYRYAPRSAVRVSLKTVSGALAVRLEVPSGVQVGRISFRLNAVPHTALRWTDVLPGAASEANGRRVEKRPDPDGGIFVDVSGGTAGAGGGEIAVIRWQDQLPPSEHGPISITLQGVRISAPNGQALDIAPLPAAVL
jgi:hypothetical protein